MHFDLWSNERILILQRSYSRALKNRQLCAFKKRPWASYKLYYVNNISHSFHLCWTVTWISKLRYTWLQRLELQMWPSIKFHITINRNSISWNANLKGLRIQISLFKFWNNKRYKSHLRMKKNLERFIRGWNICKINLNSNAIWVLFFPSLW